MIDEKHMKTSEKSDDLLQIVRVLSVQRGLRTQTETETDPEVLMGGREWVESLKEGQREEKTWPTSALSLVSMENERREKWKSSRRAECVLREREMQPQEAPLMLNRLWLQANYILITISKNSKLDRYYATLNVLNFSMLHYCQKTLVCNWHPVIINKY